MDGCESAIVDLWQTQDLWVYFQTNFKTTYYLFHNLVPLSFPPSAHTAADQRPVADIGADYCDGLLGPRI